MASGRTPIDVGDYLAGVGRDEGRLQVAFRRITEAEFGPVEDAAGGASVDDLIGDDQP